MNEPSCIGLDSQNPAKVALGSAFESHTIRIQDASLHYVSGGSGPAIIFLHGFSQDWYEFSQVMCLLAGRYTVIAVDLRGIGESTATRAEFDAETQAHDIHELASQLAIKDPYLVAHDMGGMIAYAYARLYPFETRGVAILDGPLPASDRRLGRSDPMPRGGCGARHGNNVRWLPGRQRHAQLHL